MLLADLGADVIRVDRLSAADLGFVDLDPRYDRLNRSKRAVAVDLKTAQGGELVKDLIASADLLLEGFRPGVMERLGLGPDVCQNINPRLVYGRMTGWGQDGPLRDVAGHDINYIALTGILSAIGPKDGPPSVPLNLIGDFGGGALYLAMGLLAALVEARTTGRGQVVDAAMVDGAASLMSMHFGYLQAGHWTNARSSNAVDGGAPFYTTYRTSDDKFMAVGAVEQRFYDELLERLDLSSDDLPDRRDPRNWDKLRACFATVFASRTREEWAAVFEQSNACVSPVLDMEECVAHPHLAARGTFVKTDGIIEPAPAPRFSRTPAAIRHAPTDPRSDTRKALIAWNISRERIEALVSAGVIASG
jgi:alpha-methylacyl-CoA racemase